MGQNPKVTDIFAAWFAAEHCEPSKRAEKESELNRLLDAIVAESQGQCTRDQILDHLFSSYKDYRAEQRKAAKLQVAQQALKK
jgi:hypothetical protein